MMWLIVFGIATGILLKLLLDRKEKNSTEWGERHQGRLRHALMLAQPYVLATGITGFYSTTSLGLDEENGLSMSAQMRQYFGIKPDTPESEVKASLPLDFESGWYRYDLHALRPEDDPVAAMAFACARLTFAARLAVLKSWVPADVAGRILLLNLQRAQDCFGSWEDFGAAFLRGYRQWIGAMRPDAFARHFDEASIQDCFSLGAGAWRQQTWPGLAAFNPSRPRLPRSGADYRNGRG